MAITPKPVGEIGAPTDLNEESTQSVAIPNDLTEESVESVAIPNDLTEESVESVAIPNDLTEESIESVAIPNDLTEESVEAVAMPNNLTEESVENVANPNVITKEAVGTVAIPNDLTEVAASTIPRSLTPLVDMDFAAGCYAQCGQPRTFDELFTYSRNTSASFINRRVDCNGGYEYFIDTDFVGNVENLLIRSDAFDNAAWTKTTSTVILNASKGVDGKLMDRLQEDATAAANHLVTSTATTVSSGATVTLSIDAKADERDWILLYEVESASGFYFDVKNGAVGSSSGGAEIAKIEPLSNDVFRCSITVEVPSTTATLACYLADANGSDSYSGDNISGLFIDRAQLTESTKTQPYVKTEGVAVTEAFEESIRQEYEPETGESLGVLIESASTNLLKFSEEFDSASWLSVDSTIIANDTESPDDTVSASKLEASSTANIIPALATFSLTVSSATSYTLSIYAKKLEASYIQLTFGINEVDNDPRANFDLLSGTIGDVDGDITATIKEISKDFFRISATVTTAGTLLTPEIILIKSSSDTREQSNSWVAGQGVHVWGAQCEESALISSYVYTNSSTVSRDSDDLQIQTRGNTPQSGSASIYVEYKASILGSATFNYVYESDTVEGSDSMFLSYGLEQVRVLRGSLVTASNISFNNSISSTMTESEARELSLYVDGSLSVEGSILTYYEIDLDGFIYIGRDAAGTEDRYLSGNIKSMSIYDKELTAQEVSLL